MAVTENPLSIRRKLVETVCETNNDRSDVSIGDGDSDGDVLVMTNLFNPAT